MPRSRSGGRRRPQAAPPSERAAALFEAEVLPGLAPFVRDELAALPRPSVIEVVASNAVRFRSESWAELYGLRRAVAVYRVLDFAVPRPKALLGDEHFRRLTAAITEVRQRAPSPFAHFRFGAAGRDSSVFRRLAAALEEATGLGHDPDQGALLLRVRPASSGPAWQVLVRITPRPLSARPWRVCNLVGGLNATAAVAMNDLLGRPRHGRYLNAMCGSGTLLIERSPEASGSGLVGCDLDPTALACCRQNLEAAGIEGVELLTADAVSLPLPGGGFDTVAADLPWGDAVGSHRDNARLYPAFLSEMARVTAADARLVVLTHELELFASILAAQTVWRQRQRVQIYHGGHHPVMALLTKQ